MADTAAILGTVENPQVAGNTILPPYEPLNPSPSILEAGTSILPPLTAVNPTWKLPILTAETYSPPNINAVLTILPPISEFGTILGCACGKNTQLRTTVSRTFGLPLSTSTVASAISRLAGTTPSPEFVSIYFGNFLPTQIQSMQSFIKDYPIYSQETEMNSCCGRQSVLDQVAPCHFFTLVDAATHASENDIVTLVKRLQTQCCIPPSAPHRHILLFSLEINFFDIQWNSNGFKENSIHGQTIIIIPFNNSQV